MLVDGCPTDDDSRAPGHPQPHDLQTPFVPGRKIGLCLRITGSFSSAPHPPRHRLAHSDTLVLVSGEPNLSTVIFRCGTTDGAGVEDALNSAVRRKLMTDDRALVARTKLTGPDGTPGST